MLLVLPERLPVPMKSLFRQTSRCYRTWSSIWSNDRVKFNLSVRSEVRVASPKSLMSQFRNPLANSSTRLSANERRKASRSTTIKLNLATPTSTDVDNSFKTRTSWFAPIDPGRVSVSHKRRREVSAKEEEESKKEISSKLSILFIYYDIALIIVTELNRAAQNYMHGIVQGADGQWVDPEYYEDLYPLDPMDAMEVDSDGEIDGDRVNIQEAMKTVYGPAIIKKR